MTANEAQYEAGRRWAKRRDRWAPHTEQDRLDDFDRAEASNEAEQDRRR